MTVIDRSWPIETMLPLLPYAPSTAIQPVEAHEGWPMPAPSYTQSDVSPVATVTTRSDGSPNTETKYICLPSALQTGLNAPFNSCVSCTGVPPAAAITNTCDIPERVEVYASCVPFGLHDGADSGT